MIELTVQQMVGVTNYKPKNHCAKKKKEPLIIFVSSQMGFGSKYNFVD